MATIFEIVLWKKEIFIEQRTKNIKLRLLLLLLINIWFSS